MPPAVLQRPGRPGLDERTSGFQTRIISLGPKAAESPILSYKHVQSGFERSLLVSKRRGQIGP
jgi:hypothetical protein